MSRRETNHPELTVWVSFETTRLGAVAKAVGIELGAVPGGMRLPGQAARSTGRSAGLSASVCQPSTLRMVT
jgi:hypothetical protein